VTSHFGFTKLVVQDLEAMATFYKDVAGLVEMARVQDAVGDRKIDEILFNATGQGGATFVLVHPAWLICRLWNSTCAAEMMNEPLASNTVAPGAG